MAEVIGIVASGIAIGQATTAITSSLLKLKSLWNEYRDVPEDLLHLVHELEIVYLVLAESDPQGTLETCTPSSRSLQLAWQLTNDGAKELQSLVDDLQAELKQNQRGKGNFVAAKIVLKRDQIKRLKSRLKTCIRLLTLANQSKISSMLGRQPGLLAMELTAMARNLDHSGQGDETDLNNTQQISKARTIPQQRKTIQNQSTFQLRLRLLHREWYFYCYRSHAGWDFGLRVFNLISDDDPIILACIEKDNDELLRERFRTGKASPLMLVDWGGVGTDTLLAYATYTGSAKIVQLLLDEGAKVLEDSIETHSHAIFHFASNTVYSVHLGDANNQQINEQRLLSLGEILLQDFQVIDQNIDTREDYSYSTRPDLSYFKGTLASFQLLQNSLYPNYYNMPFRSRAHSTMDTSAQYCNSPDVVRAALGSIDSSQVDLQLFIRELVSTDDDDLYQCDFPESPARYTWIESTVLICIAKRFGHCVFEPICTPSRRERYWPLYRFATDNLSAPAIHKFDEENYPLCGWQAFVAQLITAGADPSYQTLYGTALISVVVGAFTFSVNKKALDYMFPALESTLKRPDKGHLALRAWLEISQEFWRGP